jgi:two-component system cell cycle sensor histidine kinase/response regulator CckA
MPIVLVVDDEAPIRRITRLFLEQDGYQVLEASGGREALALLATGRPLDLLVSDICMPDLDGDEMVAQVRGTRPNLKVLYISGHIARLQALPSLPSTGALSKPYTFSTFQRAISALLEA